MNGSEEVVCQLIIACCDATVLLEFVDEPFNEVEMLSERLPDRNVPAIGLEASAGYECKAMFAS